MKKKRYLSNIPCTLNPLPWTLLHHTRAALPGKGLPGCLARLPVLQGPTEALMGVPENFASLTHIAMTHVLPAVNRFLAGWTEKAKKIPDPELRHQALMGLGEKKFHCEGGGVYTLLAGSAGPRDDALHRCLPDDQRLPRQSLRPGQLEGPRGFPDPPHRPGPRPHPGCRDRGLLSLSNTEGRRRLPAVSRPDLPERSQRPSLLRTDRPSPSRTGRLLPRAPGSQTREGRGGQAAPRGLVCRKPGYIPRNPVAGICRRLRLHAGDLLPRLPDMGKGNSGAISSPA